MPGFIRPFTNARRQTWAKRPAWNRWDFLEYFSWVCCHRHAQSNTDQLFKSKKYSFSPGVFQSSFSYPTSLAVAGCSYISSCLPAEASKAATMSSVFPLHRLHTTLTGPVTRLSRISCCRPTCFKNADEGTNHLEHIDC